MKVRLEANNLQMRFGRQKLFKDVSFVAENGQIIGITGANGSGKSTLVKILAGVLAPDKGSVQCQLDDVLVPNEERPHYIGLVAPYLQLYEDFSLLENLQFIAKVRGLAQASVRIQQVIQEVQLEGSEQKMIHAYSSGMKQRARFAAALLADSPILMLDEPTANLDEKGKSNVWLMVENAQKANKLIFIATNEPTEAARCERLVSL
jgi:heme exporter protein A